VERDERDALVGACEAAYDANAAEYARVLDPTLAGIVEELAARAGARAGDRALDLATGTGSLARALAFNIYLAEKPRARGR
jgi:predicted RNA methylase